MDRNTKSSRPLRMSDFIHVTQRNDGRRDTASETGAPNASGSGSGSEHGSDDADGDQSDHSEPFLTDSSADDDDGMRSHGSGSSAELAPTGGDDESGPAPGVDGTPQASVEQTDQPIVTAADWYADTPPPRPETPEVIPVDNESENWSCSQHFASQSAVGRKVGAFAALLTN